MDFHDFSSFLGKSGKLTEHPPKSYASRTTAWWPRSTSATTRSSAWLLDRSEGFIIWKFIEKCTCTYNFIQTLSDYQTFRKIIRYRGDREIRVRRNVARVPGLFECSEAPLRFGGLSVGEIGTPKILCSETVVSDTTYRVDKTVFDTIQYSIYQVYKTFFDTIQGV